MPGDHLNSDQITRIFSGSTARIEEFFSKWNFANANSTQFAMSAGDKNLLGDKIAAVIDRDELTAILLETVRLLSRERDGLESLLNNDLCDKILRHAALKSADGYPKSVHALMEAQKCLVNTMFHSAKMRDRFYLDSQNSENILQFLSEFDESQRKESKIEWIREMNQVQSSEVWYFYHRIAFIATAMNRDFQKSWANNPQMIDHLLTAVRCVLGKTSVPQIDLLRANEALKSFFNVFCHFHGEVEAINKKKAMEACEVLRNTICSVDIVGDDVIQSAIHALSVPPLPMVLSVICGDPTVPLDTTSSIDNQSIEEEREFKNMSMIEALLMALDRQLARAVALLNSTPNDQVSQEANTLTDLTGPYFQALARLCVESKHVRRYCRIRVLPPLVADEVKKRPEEHNSLRGRIVRIMMLPSATKDVAAEFLFIICKRSVNRMIKYVGFGHSAGHLANLGLLGQINQPKHASDSEDSETEDYNKVKDSVNPVTGAMYPPDHGSALAGMSDEQKEYEAMKLVDAMNKMMETGIVKPGTIGDDGKLREVSHVLELLKDAPEPKQEDSDSD